jgi:uncharacterized protein YkwD
MLAKVASRPRAAMLVLAAVIGLTATACIPDTGPPPAHDPYQTPLFNVTNSDRANYGLAPLTFSPRLSVLAGGHSCDMAQTGDLFHDNLGALLSGDYSNYSALGENILMGPPGMSPYDMEAAWMGSSSHRANILNPAYNVIGMNVCISADGRLWATVIFGRL